MVDKDDPVLTEFKGGYAASSTPVDIGAVVPDTVTINGEEVAIGKVPIPEYLAEYELVNGKGMMVEGTRQDLKGTLYFDNLTYVYGSTPEDTSAPEIESATIKAGGADAVPLCLQHGAGFRRAGY